MKKTKAELEYENKKMRHAIIKALKIWDVAMPWPDEAAWIEEAKTRIYNSMKLIRRGVGIGPDGQYPRMTYKSECNARRK